MTLDIIDLGLHGTSAVTGRAAMLPLQPSCLVRQYQRRPPVRIRQLRVLRPQSRGASKVRWRRCYGEGSDAMRAALRPKTAPITRNERAGHMLLRSCTAPSQCDSCSRQTCSYKHSPSLSFNSCAPSIPSSIPSPSTHISRSRSTASLHSQQITPIAPLTSSPLNLSCGNDPSRK